jgi:hypothetical protein
MAAQDFEMEGKIGVTFGEKPNPRAGAQRHIQRF